MSSPIRVRRGTKKEFSRVSAFLNGKIEELIKKQDALEKRIAKLEAKKPRKRKKTQEKPEKTE
ncbi:MAG TPA: hypothetical protein ENH82_01330 [bacterium]|nr:hypothetical protein [bacterium]